MADDPKPQTNEDKAPPIATARLLVVFLGHLEAGTSPTGAAKATKGLTLRTAYRWRAANAEFSQRWSDALEKGADKLEDKALEFATEGIVEYKMTTTKTAKDGTVTETVVERRRVSERLLEFQLKARRPGKYREKTDAVDPNASGNQVSSENARNKLDQRLDEISRRTAGGAAEGSTVVPFERPNATGN